MNGIKSACMTTLLVTRGIKADEAAMYVARMDDMTDDECIVALRMIGLDKTDATVLMQDMQDIHTAYMQVFDRPRPDRKKPVRKAAPKVTLMDGAKDDITYEMNREWTAEEILQREG